MARVTTEEVLKVIRVVGPTDWVEDLIEIAHRLVDDKLLGKLPEGVLKDIELYVTAHLISIRDQEAGMVTQKRVSEATSTYGFEPGMGLAMTRFGQVALTLDTTNTLASLGKRRASFKALP